MKGVCVSVLIALLTVVCFDAVAFFVLDMKPQGYRPDRYFAPSERYGFFPKANVDDVWYAYRDGTSFRVKTNSEGFADSERAVQADKPRIALIGDSTTASWEAEPHARPQFAMQSRLNDSVEVLNFGVRGFGTDQTLLLFEEKVAKYKADIVVYTFCVNDIANNGDRSGKPWFRMEGDAMTGPHGIPVQQSDKVQAQGIRRSRLEQISLSTRIIKTLTRRFTGNSAMPSLDDHFELRAYRRDYTDSDIRDLRLTLSLIARLRNRVEAAGSKFLLVDGYYRTAVDPDRQSKAIKRYGDVFDFNHVSQSLADISLILGIEFVSLAQHVDPDTLDQLTHKSDAMHLNAKGSEWFAGIVTEKLKSLNWLP